MSDTMNEMRELAGLDPVSESKGVYGEWEQKQAKKAFEEIASISKTAAGETGDAKWIVVRAAVILDGVASVLSQVAADKSAKNIAKTRNKLAKLPQELRTATNHGNKLS